MKSETKEKIVETAIYEFAVKARKALDPPSYI